VYLLAQLRRFCVFTKCEINEIILELKMRYVLTQASPLNFTLLSDTYGYKEEGIKHEVSNKTLFETVS